MTDSNLALMSHRSETVFSVTVTFFALATVFVFFRLLSRVWIVRKVSLDDWFMLLAWILTFGLSFSICYGATVGLGRHELQVPSFWQTPLRESQYAFSVLYQPALMAEKTSILVFYLSLSASNKTFRWATIITMFVVNAGGFALLMTTIFQCRPLGAVFVDPTPTTAKCTDIVIIYLASAPLNIITDLALLFLPMPILTGMRLPKKQKAILVVTFGCGLFVAIVDIVRVAYLQNAATYRLSEIENAATHGDEQDETDFSWDASLSFMWSAIEVNVGIMCACVPGLKPLFSRFIPDFIHETGFRTERTASLETSEMVAAQRIPSLRTPHVENHDFAPIEPVEEQEVNIMDFLTAPGLTHRRESDNRLGRTDTVVTNTTRDTAIDVQTWYDFVNFESKKSMVNMTNRESIFPIAAVTVLFFIWGFEYGLLQQLNAQFQEVAHDSGGQNVALHSAYFAGYLVGPLTFGRLVLKNWGFKACYSVGLSIYACGTLVFWVAAVLTSFPTYVVVNFVVGMGLSTLEIAANPFTALCGPPEYAEIRLNLSQGFQAVGTVIAPLIASKSFNKYLNDAPSLVSTQWAYLGIALFTIALAVVYYYIPLPEATDAELECASERMDQAHKMKVGRISFIWITLSLGAWGLFCYVGAQETYATTFDSFLAEVEPHFNQTNWMAIAHAAFAASRFISAGLGFFIKPRVQLAFWLTGAVIFSALSMSFTGATATAMAVVVFFFEGPLFSLVFAQSLRGLGRHTKDGSALLTTAIGGGAVFPAISYAVTLSRTAQYSLCIGVAAFAGAMILPFTLNVSALARKIVDPVHDCNMDTRPVSPTDNSSSRVLHFFSIRKKHDCAKEDDGSVSWRERTGSADTQLTA